MLIDGLIDRIVTLTQQLFKTTENVLAIHNRLVGDPQPTPTGPVTDVPPDNLNDAIIGLERAFDRLAQALELFNPDAVQNRGPSAQQAGRRS